MTAKELIKKLKEQPSNAPVVAFDSYYDEYEITKVTHWKDSPDKYKHGKVSLE